MGITQPIIDKIKSPIDSVREYKNKEVPKMQKEADEGRTPRNLDRDIERMEKLKAFADKIPPLVRTVRNTIIAIETAKKIAEAAKDAGKIGSALVPPVAAAGVLQEKIVEKVKEELAVAKAEIPVIGMLVKELKSLAIAVLIALLAIKIKGSKDNKTSDKDTDEQLQNELDGLINESENLEDLNLEGGTGSTTITRTTTASGTTITGGTGGGY